MTFPDPEKVVVDYLTGALDDVTVSTSFPDTDREHLQVEHEGGEIQWPVVERAQVRIVAWAPPGHRDRVKALAASARDALAAHPGDRHVAGAPTVGARSAVTEDPDTNRLTCWFLCTVPLLAH